VKLTSLLKQGILCASLAVAVGASSVAQADTLGTSGYAYGSQQFGLSIGGTVNAGGFAGTWNAQNIIFWCVELTQYFQPGQNYGDYIPSAPNDVTMTLLGQLFHEAYGFASQSAENSAAFQLAIWEIVYDPQNLNLGGGGFNVTNNHGNGATVDLAQQWLTHLAEYTDNYNLVLLSSGEHQNFVTFGRPFGFLTVSEPAPIALLAVAMLAMVVAMRRRKRGDTA
jgi:hypothetical protein